MNCLQCLLIAILVLWAVIGIGAYAVGIEGDLKYRNKKQLTFMIFIYGPFSWVFWFSALIVKGFSEIVKKMLDLLK